ncbi:flagellar assembly protein FliH [Biostraticola tofi]|uniref:Flagellar assembly protein FliH n=1 Tax=Biostraticola tofi TaxID=466109 RepID=A0A4R3YSU8_9GAMM|nr:flagellar assembly protein FliH [Biostraticola tofi]TCV95560.1 flagellar assembly protein FliH [Biostraticola tofi]
MSDLSRQPQWQPWQPSDLGSAFTKLEAEMIPPLQPATLSDEDWQAELLRLRQQAETNGFNDGLEAGRLKGEQHGYTAGFQQGETAGIEQGRQEGCRQQQAVTDRLTAMLHELKITVDALDQIIPARLMQVALTAAHRIIGQAPMVDGHALLKHIQQLLHEEKLFSSQPTLWVHPDDLPLLQQQLAAALDNQGWQLLADGRIQRGGCRITTDEGELDATLETRWQQLCNLYTGEHA